MLLRRHGLAIYVLIVMVLATVVVLETRAAYVAGAVALLVSYGVWELGRRRSLVAVRAGADDGNVIERWSANRTLGRWNCVGGTLAVTTDVLVFRAHAREDRPQPHDWSGRLDEVTEIGVAPRDLTSWFGGGLRKRLCVRTCNAPCELFVVRDADAVAAHVERLVRP